MVPCTQAAAAVSGVAGSGAVGVESAGEVRAAGEGRTALCPPYHHFSARGCASTGAQFYAVTATVFSTVTCVSRVSGNDGAVPGCGCGSLLADAPLAGGGLASYFGCGCMSGKAACACIEAARRCWNAESTCCLNASASGLFGPAASSAGPSSSCRSPGTNRNRSRRPLSRPSPHREPPARPSR